MVIGLELVWGIGIDLYKLARGYEFTGRAIWILIHLAIIVTGLLALRRARSAEGEAAATARTP